jgi:hypothetical protein
MHMNSYTCTQTKRFQTQPGSRALGCIRRGSPVEQRCNALATYKTHSIVTSKNRYTGVVVLVCFAIDAEAGLGDDGLG